MAGTLETLGSVYRLVDDPETGQRYLVYPNGDWAEIDMAALNDLAADGLEKLSPSQRLLVKYLSG